MYRSMLYSLWRACARMYELVSRRLFTVRACACRVLGTPVWGRYFWAPCICGCMRWRVFVASAHTFCVRLAAGGAHADKSMACVNSRHTLLTCTHVCAVYSFSFGEQGWGSSTCSWLALVSGVGGYVLEGVEIGVFVLYIFSIFTGVGVYAGVCVWMRAHTYLHRLGTRDVSQNVEMGHFESMKKSRWTQT